MWSHSCNTIEQFLTYMPSRAPPLPLFLLDTNFQAIKKKRRGTEKKGIFYDEKDGSTGQYSTVQYMLCTE